MSLAGARGGSYFQDGEVMSALEKLYSMLREADTLGLSRSARLRLIGIIGSFENEELDRYRRSADVSPERGHETERRYHRRESAAGEQRPDRRDSEGERLVGGSRY